MQESIIIFSFNKVIRIVGKDLVRDLAWSGNYKTFSQIDIIIENFLIKPNMITTSLKDFTKTHFITEWFRAKEPQTPQNKTWFLSKTGNPKKPCLHMIYFI